MTAVARLVLDECKKSLAELRRDPKNDEWRRLWIVTVALLRTVGYVLDKVDAESDPKLAKITKAHWAAVCKTEPEPAILWQFIDDERNNILKEYDIRAGINVTVRPGTNLYNIKTGEATQIAAPQPTLYDYVINAGPFKGRDQRDVVAEAIDWWDKYLSEIEAEYAHT